MTAHTFQFKIESLKKKFPRQLSYFRGPPSSNKSFEWKDNIRDAKQFTVKEESAYKCCEISLQRLIGINLNSAK